MGIYRNPLAEEGEYSKVENYHNSLVEKGEFRVEKYRNPLVEGESREWGYIVIHW